MSSTEWEGGGQPDAETVDPGELDDVPAGSAEEAGEGGGWSEGGGVLGPEGEGTPGGEAGGWSEGGTESGAGIGAGGESAGGSELGETTDEEERL